MDLALVRYVEQRFRQLQGYRLLPLAALFLISAVWRAGWFHLPGDDGPHGTQRWFAAGFIMALAASYPIGRWYSVRFGISSPRLTGTPLLAMVAVIASMPVAMAIQEQATLAFSLPMAVLGVALAAVGIYQYPLRRHYVVAAVVLFGLALLRGLGVPADVYAVLRDGAIGVALWIVGVGDHRLLAATLHEVLAGV